MGLSHRVLFIDQTDRLFRMPGTKFERLYRNPNSSRLPQFAGQRIRSVGAALHCVDAKPVQIVRLTYDIFTFDENGYLDRQIVEQQMMSRFEVWVSKGVPRAGSDGNVLDAKAKFLDKSGRWSPSSAMARAIEDALLGRTTCPRI
jgi:hypothetical protein